MNKGSSPSTPACSVVGAGTCPEGELTFTVELWDLPKLKTERVIGRAGSLEVAEAVYNTAVSQHPARRVVLRQGKSILRASA